MKLKLELEIEFDAEEWAAERGEGRFACDASQEIFDMLANDADNWCRWSKAIKKVTLQHKGMRKPPIAAGTLRADAIRELEERVNAQAERLAELESRLEEGVPLG